MWIKGQSGNPAGRPKGKTLKEFAREYLASLPNNEKLEFMNKLSPEIVWKMAEGNPHNTGDITGEFIIKPFDDLEENDSIQEDKGPEEED